MRSSMIIKCVALLIFSIQATISFVVTPPRGERKATCILGVGPGVSTQVEIDANLMQSAPSKVLVHWKGEGVEGYSIQFRHLEFRGALSSITGRSAESCSFHDALNYSGRVEMPDVKLLLFNQAMQYVSLAEDVTRDDLVKASERCSLLHALYEVVAEGESYEELGALALERGGFDDMKEGGVHEDHTWCFRARYYGEHLDDWREKRHGHRTRSLQREKKALAALEPLLITFAGRVNLKHPDCKIYVFDGLEGGKKVLARRMATGAPVFRIAPNQRICVTNTPLCPIAAFCMCNIAGVRENMTILDPFAGSCATLLAVAMIDSSCRSVGIEIAHDGLVNRDDIGRDFSTRGLVPPVALLQGDSTDPSVRAQARTAIGEQPFDLIITDPPYGIRESKLSMTPIDELFRSIHEDRLGGRPLLKKGGRLVCFLPCREEEDFGDVLPNSEQQREAGLVCEVVREQPLNDKLSRWLVSFVCVE